MEVSQSLMEEMRDMLKALIGRSDTHSAQIEGLTRQVKEIRETMAALEATTKQELAQLRAEMATKQELAQLRAEMATKQELAQLRAEMATKQELAELRAEMATKDDILILHKQIAGLKSDSTYLKDQSYRNTMDIYHLKLQMGQLHNEGHGPLQK
ncbi:hypothetical protein EV586_103705 [Tumebacillus sp. BK434]|uniref:hypothetical protein n=1 Tax=Tumebacillus sp. BK434 TaxID=2512169 RepID=UPI001042DAAC|nr:hypothetical protein [Tumebacillus sp. BK434]TCP56045.1 hypothetical protein EV586_103705 [Tumebacillus sp. BK434]